MIIESRAPRRAAQFLLLSASALASVVAHASTPKASYLVTHFVEETGSDLGSAHYPDGATSGAQCKGTFTVSESKDFSITSVKAMGPNDKPAIVKVKDAAGLGTALVPVAQSDGTGWESTSHALDGMRGHDGSWSVILPKPTSAPLRGRGGCASYGGAVRVVLAASF